MPQPAIVGSVSTLLDESNGTTATISGHTHTSGADVFAVYELAFTDDGDNQRIFATGATCNGSAMTLVASVEQPWATLYIYRRAAVSGTSATVVVTHGAGDVVGAMAVMSVSNVVSVGTAVTSTSNSGATHSVTVSGTANSLVLLAAVSARSPSSAVGSLTATLPGTSRMNLETSYAESLGGRFTAATISGDASSTRTVTYNTTSTYRALAGIELVGAASGTTFAGSGTASAVAAASGNATILTSITLGASVTATAALSGALTAPRQLGTSVTATAALSGALTAPRQLGTSVTATVALSGALTAGSSGTTFAGSGTASAVAAASGNATVVGASSSLGGSATATAALSGALTAGSVDTPALVGSVTSSVDNTPDASVTFSHTHTSGADVFVAVHTTYTDDGENNRIGPVGVTCGGVAMTLVGSAFGAGGFAATYLYRRAAVSGTSLSIVVQHSNGSFVSDWAGGVTIASIANVASVGTAVASNSASGATHSVTVSGSANSVVLLVGTAARNPSVNQGTLTATLPGTSLANFESNFDGIYGGRFTAALIAGDASSTRTVTYNTTSTYRALVGIQLIGTAAGTTFAGAGTATASLVGALTAVQTAKTFAASVTTGATVSASLTATGASVSTFAATITTAVTVAASLTATGPRIGATLQTSIFSLSTVSASLTATGAPVIAVLVGSINATATTSALLKQPVQLRGAIVARVIATERRSTSDSTSYVNGVQWVRTHYKSVIAIGAGERSALTLLLVTATKVNTIAPELPVDNSALFWAELIAFEVNPTTGAIEEVEVTGRNDVVAYISDTKELSSSAAIHADLVYPMAYIPTTNRYYVYPQGDTLQNRLLPTYRDQKIYVHFTMGAGDWHEVAETTLVDVRAAVN